MILYLMVLVATGLGLGRLSLTLPSLSLYPVYKSNMAAPNPGWIYQTWVQHPKPRLLINFILTHVL